jgi:hypothetical protein
METMELHRGKQSVRHSEADRRAESMKIAF